MHRKRKKQGHLVYLVITPGRVFAFWQWESQQTFLRRAKRLPSMQGAQIDFTTCEVRPGRRKFARSAMQFMPDAKDWLDDRGMHCPNVH